MLNEDHYYCKDCGFEVSVLDVLNKKTKLESIYVDVHHSDHCSECGQLCSKIKQEERFKCPDCGSQMSYFEYEDFNEAEFTDFAAPEVIDGHYREPLHSDTLAINPEQVAEHKEHFPNIELDDECRPVFHTVKEHEEYLEKCGIHKPINKMRKRGTIFSIPGTSCYRARDSHK